MLRLIISIGALQGAWAVFVWAINFNQQILLYLPLIIAILILAFFASCAAAGFISDVRQHGWRNARKARRISHLADWMTRLSDR